jgi:formate/nitrite transporter FocA (FNT family)
MVVPDMNNQPQTSSARSSARYAPYGMMGVAFVIGSLLGFALVQWVFTTAYGSDALGIFLLGFAIGLVLVALIGSQLTKIPLWAVLLAGQVVTVVGLVLLIV